MKSQMLSFRPAISGAARKATRVAQQHAMTYQADAVGLPVDAISQATMNRPKPPKIATPSA